MSLLTLILCSYFGDRDERNKANQCVGTAVVAAVLAVLGLSLFLAVRDMSLLSNTTTKVWVFLMALFMPELYVVLHGISSSSAGLGFFEGAPVESGAALRSWTPSSSVRTEPASPTELTATPSSLLGL